MDQVVKLKLAGSGPAPLKAPLRLTRPDDGHNPMPTVIQAAYEEPVVRQISAVGSFYVMGAPEAVKRVLLDNVGNYPKTAMERRFFTAAFGDGLLSSEGEVWRSHRRTMAPSFAPPSVAAYAPGMVEEALACAERWEGLAGGGAIDISREMSRLTLRIISRAMFSADGSDLGEMVETALKGAMDGLKVNLFDFVPGIDRLIGAARARRMQEVFAELDGVIAGMIAERERNPHGKDLLARLIEARDSETGQAMSASVVRDQMLTIFVAGHETTAAGLAWTWYLLSQHPDAEARLHEELDRVLGGRAPTQEDLAGLTYTRMVIDESMRLYPPAPGTSTRQAVEEDEVCGVRIPKGAPVTVIPWVTHRHRGYWDRPELFQPERFSRAAAAERPRFAYIPFGGGPRVCIGASLATTEMVLVLAVLAQKFRLALPEGHEVLLQHQVTMRPRGGLPMSVTRR